MPPSSKVLAVARFWEARGFRVKTAEQAESKKKAKSKKADLGLFRVQGLGFIRFGVQGCKVYKV